jgi:hypothetical protein
MRDAASERLTVYAVRQIGVAGILLAEEFGQ